MTDPQDRGRDASGATTGSSEETRRTLSDEITPRERAFITAAAEIEAQDAASAGEVGFVSPLLADFGLPLRNPGQVSRWERKNGNQLLIMRPAALADKDGNITDGFPFGLYPRLILAHLATEAKTKQSPVVSVGKSLNAFMAHLGLHKDGRSRRGFIDQVARLTGAAVTIKHINKGHKVYRTDNYTIASSVSLWLGDDERPVDEIAPDVTTSDRLIWPETVHLSAEFYANLDAHAVPVDLRALRALAPWPSAMDCYVWLTRRVYGMDNETEIPWELLANQFGSRDALPRRFKAEFLRALDEKVHPLYPAVKYGVGKNGLVLYPSPTHVPTTKPRRKKPAGQPESNGPASKVPTRKPKPVKSKAKGWCGAHDQWAPCTGCAGDRKAGGAR